MHVQQCFFKVNRVVFHVHHSFQSLTATGHKLLHPWLLLLSRDHSLLLALWRLLSHCNSSASHHFQVPDSLQCPGMWVYSVVDFSHFIQGSMVQSGFVTKLHTTRSSSSISSIQRLQTQAPFIFLTSNLHITHVPLAIISYSALFNYCVLNTYASAISTSVQYRLFIFGYFLRAILQVSDSLCLWYTHFAH